MATEFYNRILEPQLVELLQNKYHWLIEYVQTHSTLEFQVGRNKKRNSSYCSLYKGTSRILQIQNDGKCNAKDVYKQLQPNFYISPTQGGLEKLLKCIADTPKLNRYDSDREGHYQKLLGRRYTLLCQTQDDFILFDKEAELSYTNKETKRVFNMSLCEWKSEKIDEIQRAGIQNKFDKQSCYEQIDYLGLTKRGDLLVLEVKKSGEEDYAPLQVGFYDELLTKFMNSHKEELQETIHTMLEQKKELGLLCPKSDFCVPLSGKIRLGVVVGGQTTKTSRERFRLVRSIIGKNITYYICGTNGQIIEQEL